MVGYCVTDVLLYCIQATKDVNNMTVKMPYQCFINGQFEDAENGKTYDTINPTDGSVSHKNTLTHESTHMPQRHKQDCGVTEMCDHCVLHQVICKVSYASVGDVDQAVAAAKEAYDNGPWGKMNPRDRGSLLYK